MSGGDSLAVVRVLQGPVKLIDNRGEVGVEQPLANEFGEWTLVSLHP